MVLKDFGGIDFAFYITKDGFELEAIYVGDYEFTHIGKIPLSNYNGKNIVEIARKIFLRKKKPIKFYGGGHVLTLLMTVRKDGKAIVRYIHIM
jgi:hypothetical protein